MTQQSHYQAYTLRKPEPKKARVPQCSLQLCLQQTRTWKQLGCPSTDEWINNKEAVVPVYNGIFSAVKRNTFESVLMRWMNLESVIQSEVSQKEKNKYHVVTQIHGIQKHGTDEPICRAGIDTDIQNKWVDVRRRGGVG